MYQSCNRRLLPSMASLTLFSPAATLQPCYLHCDSASHVASYRHSAFGLGSQPSQFFASKRCYYENENCSEGGSSLLSLSYTHSRTLPACFCFCCARRSVRRTRTSFCVELWIGSPSMSGPLLGAIDGSIHGRKLPQLVSCYVSGTGNSGSQTQVRAVSTSMAVSSKKKSKESEISVIDQPSLTWGIVPVPSEGKEKVIEFLEKEGIDTSELHDVELPNTIEVMQERIDFLKKLGLSLDVINSYPLMVTCSIKKNLVPVLDYLEQLGLRSKDLPKFVEKYPMVLHSSVIIDLMPVVDYLLGLDIQRKDIIRVLMRYPDVLGFRLEGTMSTSVAYIVSLGVRMRCIGRMLTEYPEILGMRVGNNIKPKVDFLLSYGIPKPVIAKLLEVRPYILGFDLTDNMQSVVDDLLEAGVRKEGIANIITQYPDILGQDIKQNLAQKCKWLMQQVAVQAEDVPVIFENLPQILFIKEGLAMERVRFFRNAGLSAEDVALMVVECPQILALSIEHTIQPSLNFLLHDMKRSVKEVVKFPSYFTYDLKSRIMPRYKLITEKGIDCSLEWFLNCTDQRLKGRLSDEYLDNDAPGPVFQMGGVVHTEIKPLDENLHSDMAEKGKRDEQQSPYLNQRQTSMSHQWERKLYTSDSDIENSSGNENESDMYEAYSELEEDSDEDDDGILSSLRGLRNTNKAVDVRKQQKASYPSLESMSEEEDYSENDFTDDAQDILRARLNDDEDLEMLESASDSEFHEGVVDDSMVDDDWSISEDEEEQYNERWKRNI